MNRRRKVGYLSFGAPHCAEGYITVMAYIELRFENVPTRMHTCTSAEQSTADFLGVSSEDQDMQQQESRQKDHVWVRESEFSEYFENNKYWSEYEG